MTKPEMLKIILATNPAPDEFHTWIRSEEDILTLAEAVEEWSDFDEYNPDWTRSDALEAIDRGSVVVYSSKPIRAGSFVSPSKMEAESYSEDGNIYSMTINIFDVAWLDPTQGAGDNFRGGAHAPSFFFLQGCGIHTEQTLRASKMDRGGPPGRHRGRIMDKKTRHADRKRLDELG